MENIKVEIVDNSSELIEIKRKLRNLQSLKSRLKKQKSRSDYEEVMAKTQKDILELQDRRNVLDPKDIKVTTFSQKDIDTLTYIETMRAIKSIQSKKCLTKDDDFQDDYEHACKIEDMLLEHKKITKPIEENVVSKKSIQDTIHTLEQMPGQEEAIIQLQKLL